MKRKTPFLALLLVLAWAVVACRGLTAPPATLFFAPSPEPVVTAVVLPDTSQAAPQVVQSPPVVDLGGSQDTLIRLYQQVSPGVVSLSVLTTDGSSLGSGFVLDKEGHIITNYHVIENHRDLEITFPSGIKTRGEVLGTDLDSDLAVIKVDLPPELLHPLTLGDSDQVQVGQMVVAVGNPFGFDGTMTIGIVSGLGRTLRSLHTAPDGSSFTAGDIIQTDAALNPGNSGGPLFNLSGEVIGINESIMTNGSERVNSGVGFAISINIVKRVAPALVSGGKYDYPYLGIFSSTSDLSLSEQEALGLPYAMGVYITNVTPGGPAQRAGLRGGDQATNIPGLRAGGDLIVGVDGHPVRTFNDLIGYLIKTKSPGDTVLLTVLRGSEEIQVELTLDKRPGS